MGIPVAEILELHALDGVRVIAGHRSLGRTVNGLAMMEDLEGIQWIRPNNIILTNGYALGVNIDQIREVFSALSRQKVSGVFIKFGRHIPEAPQSMIEAANAYGIPLVALPSHSTPTQLINTISYEIFRNESHDLSNSYEVDILCDIINENVDWHILKSRLTQMEWSTRRKMGIALLRSDELVAPQDLADVCADAGFKYSFQFYRKQVALVDFQEIAQHRQEELAGVLSDRARDLLALAERRFPGHSWRIGLGSVCTSLTMLPVGYKEALAALCFGIAERAESRIVPYENLGVFAALLESRCRKKLEACLGKLISLLEQRDPNNSADLARTFKVYARSHCSIKTAAETLFVHPNTVRYRIDMIKRTMESHVLPESVETNIALLCAFVRWLDVYNAEIGFAQSEDPDAERQSTKGSFAR